ncbi:hypothetical protein SAMN05444372_112108 [Flavobacterium micromati]|uniref:Uncharacterized protein n=1 Tax=Flavobacterium micromati TaxID=229205 RepID=A0A1M5P8Y1_9FLAO|nr:DUF5694 domain-containing protein [Flavobacterium micromati]SHG98240.1 hypothetical protein SAMN05444372_112108 [Flavobacterium micromati]
MTTAQKTILITSILAIYSCKNSQSVLNEKKNTQNIVLNNKEDQDLKKIPVLNFGTFHMGLTNDATTTEFDENDRKNQLAIKEIAKKLSEFRPTVIIVERPPSFDNRLQAEYSEYVSNPKMKFKDPSEIELLAYELGRISGTKRIYGVDHKMSYNYNIGSEMTNSIDSTWHNKYYKNPLQYYPDVNIDQSKLNLLEKLKITNQQSFLDFLIEVNAEMLAHVGSEKGFEGADEATKYYQRNIRMYSNLNRIPLNENDRVFIILGASHTAYFKDFIQRSPKFKMVDTFQYLN